MLLRSAHSRNCCLSRQIPRKMKPLLRVDAGVTGRATWCASAQQHCLSRHPGQALRRRPIIRTRLARAAVSMVMLSSYSSRQLIAMSAECWPSSSGIQPRAAGSKECVHMKHAWGAYPRTFMCRCSSSTCSSSHGVCDGVFKAVCSAAPRFAMGYLEGIP